MRLQTSRELMLRDPTRVLLVDRLHLIVVMHAKGLFDVNYNLHSKIIVMDLNKLNKLQRRFTVP
jgi:hypothetical protein